MPSLDDASNTQEFWLDGKAIDDFTIVEKGEGCGGQTNDRWLHPNTKKSPSAGKATKPTPPEVWSDDFAIGTTQIGCPQ